jgi:uncharacterized membrane protein YidH (DUF202 family)
MSKEIGLALPKENYLIIIGGVVLVLLGFVLMSGGGADDPDVFVKEELFSFRRITLAPFLVILGYVVVLYGVLKRPKNAVIIQTEETVKEKNDLV